MFKNNQSSLLAVKQMLHSLDVESGLPCSTSTSYLGVMVKAYANAELCTLHHKLYVYFHRLSMSYEVIILFKPNLGLLALK